MSYFKRQFALLLVLACVSHASLATIQINWTMDVYDQNGNPAPSNWIAQLIWSLDAVVSPPDDNNPFIPTQGEVVLHQQMLNSFGSPGFIVPDFYEFDDIIAGGFVYVRIFNSAPSRHGDSEMSTEPLFITNDPFAFNGFENIIVFVDTPVANCPAVGTLCDDNDPYNYDTDGDGLSDGDEYLTIGTNPLLADTDQDGLSDGAEVNTTLTNPLLSDTDGDGCDDLLQYGGQCPNQPAPCLGDLNGDGVVNAGDLLAFLSAFGSSCL